ncbi:putative peptidyl-tRNA hydrolase PTRHD1 [Durio zibethinus]|uniref:peptidyl-tRNA hydrolase n=1 Tax=Durio zibethinus TaxID=66656 RepID=A0A6P5XQC3_DURZI|nr:putative peptidyl-tRNA hydrolase PTRHD1 [Durio zibethinus]
MAALPSLCRCFTTILGSYRPSRRSFNIRVHPSSPIRLTTRKLSSSMSQPNSEPAATKTATPTAGNNDDVLVQYVVLRRDLIDTWSLGSVVTQGCHASVSAIWSHKDDPHTLQYCRPENIDSMHKVTLEVMGEAQILNLSEKLTDGGIAHKLWIEQPENIPTCLATKPYPKSMVSLFFKKFKLCK